MQIHHWSMHQINGLEKDKVMVALMNKRMHDISSKLANAFYNLVSLSSPPTSLWSFYEVEGFESFAHVIEVFVS